MAQTKLLKSRARTYFGLETSFANTGSTSFVNASPVVESMDLSNIKTNDVEVLDESVFLHDVMNRVHGLQSNEFKFGYYLKPHATVLSGANTPVTHSLGVLFRTVLGGEQVSSSATVGVGSTTSQVITSVANAAKFPVGIVAGFPTTSGLQPAFVISNVSDSLGVWPALASAPTNGQSIANFYNYYPTETNTNTMAIRHCEADNSSYQWEFLGTTGEIEIALKRGELMTLTMNAKAALHTGPQALGFTATVTGSDGMAPPLVLQGGLCMLLTSGSTTRTHYPLVGASFKMKGGGTLLEELSNNSTNGFSGVMKTGSRVFSDIELEFESDLAHNTTWSNNTDLSVWVHAEVGSGLNKRFIGFFFPSCQIIGEPNNSSKANDRQTTKLMLQCKRNALVAPSLAPTELNRAPGLIFLG